MRISRRTANWSAVGLALLTAIAAVPLLVHADPPVPDGAWRPTFAAGRALITNEVAYRSPGRVGTATSPDWIVTSGSLYADNGRAWSGYPDDGAPDVASDRSSGSAVLRAVSRPDGFGDVRMHLSLEVTEVHSSARTGANSWDGVHLFVRYTSPDQLYVVTACRRDGTVAIKKKVPLPGPASTGRYVTLASAPLGCTLGRPVGVDVDVRDAPDGVHLALLLDGAHVLSAVDGGQDGTAPLTGAGRVGVRGDNTDFRFGGVTVSAVH